MRSSYFSPENDNLELVHTLSHTQQLQCIENTQPQVIKELGTLDENFWRASIITSRIIGFCDANNTLPYAQV